MSSTSTSGIVAVSLDDVATVPAGGNGVHWSLDGGTDLNANLVHLDPGACIEPHVNDEVDVLFVVTAGSGRVVIDGAGHDLGPHVLALAPKGARRALVAGDQGVTYVTVHRRRAPLGIGAARRAVPLADEGGEAPCFAHLLEESDQPEPGPPTG